MNIERFVKRPVVVEAIQYIPGDTCEQVSSWMGVVHDHDDCSPSAQFLINTKEGVMAANPGDWIIRGIQGEFYPCKPDIFEATYNRWEP